MIGKVSHQVIGSYIGEKFTLLSYLSIMVGDNYGKLNEKEANGFSDI